jgi:hypothetical protein
MIAAAGLIIGGIGWAVVLDYRTSAVQPAATGTTGTLHTGQVVSGMCIKNAPNLEKAPGPVTVVPCAQAHRAEALIDYTFTVTTWPGTRAARAEVVEFCAVHVVTGSGLVPVSPDAPAFEWQAWVPTEQTWNLGDRQGLCVVTTTQPVAGSYGAGTAYDAKEDSIPS